MVLKAISTGNHKFINENYSHSVRFQNGCGNIADRINDFVGKNRNNDSLTFHQTLQHQSMTDSGAPSPDLFTGPPQPAAQRLKINEQRIKLLTQINQVVQERAELEANHQTLLTLQEQLKKKLKIKIQENHTEKKETLTHVKRCNTKLDYERTLIVQEIDHLSKHLDKEEQHHIQHARSAAADSIQGQLGSDSKDPTFVSKMPVFSPLVSGCKLGVIKRGSPSKKADMKISASRLMREIIELRNQVCTIETRLSAEIKRKKQIEAEILKLRKELSLQKSSVASLRLPLAPLQKKCTKFV